MPSAPKAPYHVGPYGSPAGAIESESDRRLVAAIQGGLPLVSDPFSRIATKADMSEERAIQRLREWSAAGVVSRFGVIVRHRRLGYRANAMVVWDIPDDDVSRLGRCMGQYDFVTLCYRRPRRLPEWRYNLFCMIHGRDRDTVTRRVELLAKECGLEEIPHRLLFSRRSFKQRGARYQAPEAAGAKESAAAVRRPELAEC